MSQAGVADSLAPSAGSTTAAGSKRKLHAEEVEAAAAAMPPAAGSDSISPAPKKARLAIQCMTVAERAALDASLASSRAANPNHGGERVCVRSAIEVDEAGLPVVHLDIFTPTAASRAALKEAKYQAQRAKFIEKKQGARARAKAAKAVARSEKEQFEAELVAAGKTKEEIIAAMRERWAQNNGGKASKRAGRHVQDAKRSLMTRMRAGQLQRVAVDCSFDHLMRVEEVCSLAKQIRHMYGHNVRSEQPLHLVLTSLGEATPGEKVEVDHFADLQKAMQEASTANASAVAATSTTVDAAEGAQATDDARASPSAASSATPATPVCTTRSVLQRMDGFDRLALDRTTAAYTDCFPRSSLVYLTAESPNVIDKLDPSKVYIIGGIVDHNRMKGLCHRLATEGDIPTARLPIPEFLVNDKRTVITVNQGTTRDRHESACVPRSAAQSTRAELHVSLCSSLLLLPFLPSLRDPPPHSRASRC